MTIRFGGRAQAIAVAAALGLFAVGAYADGARPQADDKCVAQCDEASDKCMSDAGGSEAKEKACDDAYDECLRKCG